MITFEPLWNTLQKKQITQYRLITEYKISRGQINRLKHNQNVSMKIVDKLCGILDCTVEDIIEFRP